MIRPEDQYLYPEFCWLQRFFQKHGIESEIVDAARLRYEHGQLLVDDRPIDLVYDRVVDFSLALASTRHCGQLIEASAVVVTPNPHVHALSRTSAT